MALTATDRVGQLIDLAPRLQQVAGFVDVVSALQGGTRATIDGAWGSSCALAVAALAARAPANVLVVLPRIADVDEFADDLAGFLGRPPLVFPAWESLPEEHDVSDEIFGRRLRVLREIDEAPQPRVIVTSLPALLQPVPSRAERERATHTLRVGEEIEPDALLRWLVDRGFDRVPAIALRGEFSLRGGIVDLFPPDADDPLRIEFMGDEIESIRRFDVETQRRLEELHEIRLTLVSLGGSRDEEQGGARDEGRGTRAGRTAADVDTPLPLREGLGEGLDSHAPHPAPNLSPQGERSLATTSTPRSAESFLTALSPTSWVVLSELADLVQEGKDYLDRLVNPRGLFSVAAALARCAEFANATVSALPSGDGDVSCHLEVESIERFIGPRNEVLVELATVIEHDNQVLIACHNEGERQRLAELLADAGRTLVDKVELCVGQVSRGFRLVQERIVVLGDHQLFNRIEVRRPSERRKARLQTRAIDSFIELKEGDLVVHLTKGIGRYRGMQRLENGSQVEEHLVLEFRDHVRVLVPASLIHLVQKYVGAAKATPTLSKLGSQNWTKRKQRVAQAVLDMASDMLRLQAAREAKPGIACPPDSHWQKEFEAAFPYTETPDQLDSIVAVKDDMQRERPMDRLICGDVGYGKTEVAMRAAFKAIEGGRQVAVLVPTTVLAEQHFRTFSERMAEYPVNIEVLSRFRSKGQQQKIVERMEAGGVDLVIGTHRLVQKDVRFKNLGLLVIDEEQRFGVEAKETLKRMRLEVDVLTMSATPIPRTLHMSLLGIRDISNLVTAPQDRQAIETRVCRFSEQLVRSAIVRELNRNGQVYYVHNRVHSIHEVADRVQRIVPEARIGIGHGQMREHELEEAMYRFVTGQTDILVCTTIIESGLDIPNANTMFIDQADRYGLADLHQLRGRVGRYKHRAYCYLLMDENRTITPAGGKRLKAIEEFSELGAGFKIAMRDLEIRGAGNILGTEQSGHIASVGYELYCQLLENAVRGLKHEPPREHLHVECNLSVTAYLPDTYVPAGRQKIDVYRKLSLVRAGNDLDELEDELRDRFGPPPLETRRMFELKTLQLAAHAWGIRKIHLEDRFAVFTYEHVEKMRELQKLRGSRLRIVDLHSAYWLLEDARAVNEALMMELGSVLRIEQKGGSRRSEVRR